MADNFDDPSLYRKSSGKAAAAEFDDPSLYAPEPKTRNPIEGARASTYNLGASLVRALAGVTGDIGEKFQTTIPSNLISDTPMLDAASFLERKAGEVGYVPEVSETEGMAALTDPITSVRDLVGKLGTAGRFSVDTAVSSAPMMAGAILAPEALVAARTEQIATERAKNDGHTEVTGEDRAKALPAAIVETFGERFASRFIPGLGGNKLSGEAAERAIKQLGLQTGTEAAQGATAYLGETVGTEAGVDPASLRSAAILEALGGAAVGAPAAAVEMLPRRAVQPTPVDADPILAAVQAATGAAPAPEAATSPEALSEVLRAVIEAQAPAAVAPAPVETPPLAPAAAPRQGEPAPVAGPVVPDRLEELRTARLAGPLTPEQANEMIDLQEQDARTARLAGTGTKLAGVQTMAAEREAPPAPRKGFLDLDNFKAVNDSIGHGAGDEVIGQVASLLAERFPGQVFHKGGDEFIVHGVDDAALAAGMDAVRNTLASTPIEVVGADGEVRAIPGLGLSYGIGGDINEAETGLQRDKGARRDAGLRTERGADRRATDRGGPDRRSGQGDERAGQGAAEAGQAPSTLTDAQFKALEDRKPVELAISLRDGMPVKAVITPPSRYNEGGRDHQVELFLEDGRGIGHLSYGTQEVGGGTTSRAGPLVMVDEAMRRRGIATTMYEIARAAGGLFPPLDATNADRTELGQAMREGMARKGVSPDRTPPNRVTITRGAYKGYAGTLDSATASNASITLDNGSKVSIAPQAVRRADGQPVVVASVKKVSPVKAERDRIEDQLAETKTAVAAAGGLGNIKPAIATTAAPTEEVAASPERQPTSTKNEVTDAEREARGEEPLRTTDTKTNENTLAEAREALAANPSLGPETINKIRNAGTEGITLADEAVLLAEKVRLQGQRDAASEKLSNPDATPEQKAVANTQWTEAEAQIAALDEATRAGGAEWGRLGQFRQRLLRQDYTFESLERRRRAALERPLTPEESATIKRQAEAIEKLQARLDAALAAREESANTEAVATTYAELLRDMGVRATQQRERPTLDALKARADKARAALAALEPAKNTKQQGGSIIDPRAFVYLAEIGAYHVANGAAKFADWSARMTADIGAKFSALAEDAKRAIYDAARGQTKGGTGKRVPKAKRKPEDVLSEIDPAKLTHRDVYNLAAAHVAAGVKGETAVMQAVLADLKGKLPDLTERDVRRLFSDYGRATFPSKDADKIALRELRALVQLQESIDRLQEGMAALKSGPQRDKATKAIRDKRKQLNDLLKKAAKNTTTPERLAAYLDARATNLRNQIEDLEKQLATGEKPEPRATAPKPTPEIERLINRRDALKAELKAVDDAAKPVKSPEQRYQEAREKSLRTQLENVRRRIATNDYSRSVKPAPRILTGSALRLSHELSEAKRDFAVEQYKIDMAKRHPIRKVLGGVSETFNLARAIMTSIDLSGLLRQAGFITLAHPVRGANALGPALKAFASDRFATQSEREIHSRPNAELYKRAKLELTDANAYKASTAEEAFMSRLVEHVPKLVGGGLLRGSQRAFVTTLNRIRADSFDAMLYALARKGDVPTDAEINAIANFINVATGRGKIGSGKKQMTGLNVVFFAPRLVASRFNLLAGQPMYGGTARTRVLVAQEYARFLIGAAVVFGLATLAQDEEDRIVNIKDGKVKVNTSFTDPRSSNFLKIKFGNTFIDPMTGLSQVTVFLAKTISGEARTGAGVYPLRKELRWSDMFDEDHDYLPPTPWQDNGGDVIGRFARTKLAPVPGATWNALSGEDVIGNETSVKEQAVSLITPLSMRDVENVMTEHGLAKGTAITMLNMLGMGVQYRDPNRKKKDKKSDDAGKNDPRQSSLPESRRAEYVGRGDGMTVAPEVLAGAKNAPKMIMVGDWSGLPSKVAKQFDGGAEGVFDPETGKVYVAMGMTPERAKFVAYHEIAGHYGLQGAMGDDYEPVLNRAMQNPTVAKLARAMQAAGYEGEQNRLAMTEEALSELAAARRSGNYAMLEKTRGVKIPDSAKPGIGGTVARAVMMTKRVLAKLTDAEPSAYDDDQVYDLITDAWRYVERAPATPDED